ncbi:MAG TPA: endonuclease/exonuclease/phosphatase family protein [Candidatus Paceibacterota bacterium]
MKIITLNLWGGIVYEPLLEFIKKHSMETDIFCFQEVLFGDVPGVTEIHKARMNLFTEVSANLSDFIAYKYISNTTHFQREPINFKGGQAIFVRKSIPVKESGGLCSYENLPGDAVMGSKITGNMNWVNIGLGDEHFIIANLHGIHQAGTDALDTPERLFQSEKINNFLSINEGKQILCGDFNLNPNGKSIQILGKGMRNLITENRIASTRSSFYTRNNKCSDYVLVSWDVEVKDFKVLQDQVSDHLPIFAEFV